MRRLSLFSSLTEPFYASIRACALHTSDEGDDDGRAEENSTCFFFVHVYVVK